MSPADLKLTDLLDAAWVRPIWQQFLAATRAQRLPHAVLLGGAAGLGQDRLAEAMQAALICASPTPQGLACDACRACHLRQQGSHPDVHRVVPLEGKASIGVDQVRELGELLQFAPQRGTRRVALIHPAEGLSLAACNALLKTLEEPTPGALLLLVSAQPRGLLPTLRSRCVQWLLPVPSGTEALRWLQARGLSETAAGWHLAQSHGAPLAAWARASDPTTESGSSAWADTLLQWLNGAPGAHAAEWVKRERTRADAVARWLEALLSVAAQPQALPLPAPIQALAERLSRLDHGHLQGLARRLWQLQRWIGSGVRLDLQLLQVLQELRRLCHPAALA